MSGLQAWLQANHAVPPVALRAHQIPGKGGCAHHDTACCSRTQAVKN